MKEYSSDKIRNVAVVSHDGAGKTALVESLLLTSGAVDFVGKGQDNKHIMDFEPEEIKRNVTIQLGTAPCECCSSITALMLSQPFTQRSVWSM